MVDLNLENVDERPEKHKYLSVQIPGSCRGGRHVTHCLATLTQGWTELCQGKKAYPLSCSPQTQTPGRKKIPAVPSKGTVPDGTE